MIGLASVLLRLCLPLMVSTQLKVLIVDPTYSAVKSDEASQRQVHMKDFDKETCLIPFDEDEVPMVSKNYNFCTELFFMVIIIVKNQSVWREINQNSFVMSDTQGHRPLLSRLH